MSEVYISDRIAGLDPLTGTIVRLFDPRHQVWREHFAWTAEGDRLVGVTPTGRATIAALYLNRPSLAKARRAWVSVGWHPPYGLKRLSTWLHSLTPTLSQREKQLYPGPYALRGTSLGILFSHHERGSDATITIRWR
jgi:hypothetical protein